MILVTLGCSGADDSTDAFDQAQPNTESGTPNPLVETSTTTPEPDASLKYSPLRQGIDLSSHSGEIDWTTLSGSDFDFVFLKATEGVDLADSAFDRHWKAAADAGLVRGAYHFYVTEDDPTEQAEFFISRVDLTSGDLRPVVDIELLGHNTQSGLPAQLRIFLEALTRHYKVAPIIYTSPNFWDQNLDDSFGDYPLWIAEYGVDEPRLPKGWDRWSLWQWEDDSNVAGVEHDADLSRVHPSVPRSALTIP